MRPTKTTSSTAEETQEPIGQRSANQGKLSDMNAEKLLQAYRQQRATGILTFENPRSGRWQLYFMEGDIIAATTELEDLRLGRMLYRSGKVTRAQLDAALSLRRETFTVGEALVSKGAITSEERSNALTAQFREILFTTFLFHQGTWNFVPQDAIFADNLQLFFDSDELIAEGVRLATEVKVLARELETDEHIYQRVGTRPSRSLRREQEEFLRLVDGQRSTAELFVLSPLERLATLQLLTQLIEQGQLRKVGEKPPSRPELLPSYPYLPEELRDDVRRTDIIPRRVVTSATDRTAQELPAEATAAATAPSASDSAAAISSSSAKGKNRTRTTAAQASSSNTAPDSTAQTAQASAQPPVTTPFGDSSPAELARHLEAALDQLNPVADALGGSPSADVPSAPSLNALESAINLVAPGRNSPSGELTTATAAEILLGTVGEANAAADVDARLGAAIEALSAQANPLQDMGLGEAGQDAGAGRDTVASPADSSNTGSSSRTDHDASEASVQATSAQPADASAEQPYVPGPDEPEIQELWSDEPAFQPRDHSNPGAGVFLSGDSVLDTVDLSHFNPVGLATDIPLDGIVETAGVEDYEHEQSEYDHEDSEPIEDTTSDHELDSVHLSQDDVAGIGESSQEWQNPQAGWSEEEDVVSLSPLDIVNSGPHSVDASHAQARSMQASSNDVIPPIYEEDTLGADALGEDALSSLDDDELDALQDSVDEDDDSDVEELEEEAIEVRGNVLPSNTVAPLDELDDDADVLRLEDIASTEPVALSVDEEAEDLSALDIAQLEPVTEPTAQDSLDTTTFRGEASMGRPLLPKPTRMESRLDASSARHNHDSGVDDDGDASASIQPIELIEDFSEAESLIGMDPNNALFKPMQPLKGMSRPAATRSMDAESLSPEEEALLSNISGIFRARSRGLRDKKLSRGGRRAVQDDLKRAGAMVSLNATQKSLLRERSEMYNHIYSVIFAHLARKLGRDRTRAIFQEFFAPGNGSYPEMFQGLTFKGDGMVDAEQLLRNLEAYPTHRPVQLLESSLSDIFHFLIRQIDQGLDPAEQSQMMDGLTPLFNLLNKRNEGSA